MMLTTASRVKAAKRYARNGQYPEAAVIAEKIRYSKVSSIHELSALASIFLRVKQYDEAKAVYLEMYSRAKTHKVMVGLIDLCLKTQEPKQAEKFLREFRRMEPENPERLVFRYRVDCMLGKSNEYLLKSLTKLKEEDYTDIWALELAKIYFKENDMAACAKECRDILLWFPDSEVAPKAKVLLGACEDVFEAAGEEPQEAAAPEAADALQEGTASGASVDVVEITNSEPLQSSETEIEKEAEAEKEAELALEASIADAVAGLLDGEEAAASEPQPSEPVLYDRIIYDDDDEEEDEYVIRDYFVESEEEPRTEEPLQPEATEEEAALKAEAQTGAMEEEPLPVIELPVIGVPMEGQETEAEDGAEVLTEKETENKTKTPSVEESVEQKPYEEELSVEEPAERKPYEEKLAEEAPAGQKPYEKKPSVEAPAEQKPYEEKPSGEKFAELNSVEKTLAEEPVEEEPVEKKPADGAVPDLSQIRVDELVFDADSSTWETPDDGLLPEENPEKWMQEVNITNTEPEKPKETKAASERELTEAALAAMFREDDVAIERALYDLLKKD